jgi:RNA polymerase sigma factor (sigma-70 family)
LKPKPYSQNEFDHQTPTDADVDRRAFDEEISHLFKEFSTTGLSTFNFVNRMLRQFRLNGEHSAESILTEAYVRGIASIEKGRQIKHPTAWIRSAALLVIRELSRERQRAASRSYAERASLLESALPIIDNLEEIEQLTAQIKLLKKALKKLPENDAKLLELRYILGLSWTRIAEELKEEGRELILRKRGSRAMARLKEAIYAEKEIENSSPHNF